MSFAASPDRDQQLRIVRDEPADGVVSHWPAEQRARLDIIKENRIAAHAPEIDPRDPRWVLAMQTHARLQGTALTPEHRDQLLKSGKKMGLRPFEANLVIALVQDRARNDPVFAAAPQLRLVRTIEHNENLVAQTHKAVSPAIWPKVFAAVAAALAVAALLIRWLAAK